MVGKHQNVTSELSALIETFHHS